jgi:aminopeptidase S
MRSRSALAFLLWLPLLAPAQPYGRAAFEKRVGAISAGTDRAGRRAAITAQLEAMGLFYRLEDFKAEGRAGVNILVTMPAAAGVEKEILLGAHYDKAEVGQGALDNASGVGAVLELLARFRKSPLAAYRLSAAFFDLEEEGGLGAHAFIASRGRGSLPAIYVNFDVFGYGDTLWAMSVDKKSRSAQALGEAAARSRFPLVMEADYPPGDDRVFLGAEVETLGLALIDGREIEPVLKYYAGQRPDPTPRVMQILHSPYDTPDKIAGADVARALPVVEEAVRLMDAALTAAPPRASPGRPDHR